MKKRLATRRPSAAMIVAMTALVMAFTGPALADQAASIAKKINGKNLKTRSISGNKLKNNTVTGIQVAESKLGKVPSATKADTATSATDRDDRDQRPTQRPQSSAALTPGSFVQRLFAVVDGDQRHARIVRGNGYGWHGRRHQCRGLWASSSTATCLSARSRPPWATQAAGGALELIRHGRGSLHLPYRRLSRYVL